MSKRLLIAAVLALLTLGTSPVLADSEVWREQSRHDEPGAGLTVLEVENSRGRIEVRPSPDGILHVTALKIVRAGTPERARELARRTTVETLRRAGRFEIRVRYPQRHSIHLSFWSSLSGITMPRAEVRLSIQAPPKLALYLRTTSGDLVTEELSGSQVLRTTSGDVEVHDARGPLEFSSTSGDLTGEGLSSVHISTTSGESASGGPPAPSRSRPPAETSRSGTAPTRFASRP